MPLCRHCDRTIGVPRPKGLCTRCYFDPAINCQYDFLTPARGKSGGVNFNVRPRPASAPTAAQPGSLEKIAVMEERVKRGEEVFHPGDFPSSLRHWLDQELDRIIAVAADQVIEGDSDEG